MRLFARFALLVGLVAGVTAVPVTVAGAASESPKAGIAAFGRYVEQLNKRQWGRTYKSLYPGQRSQITLGQYSACQDKRDDGLIVEVDSIDDAYFEKQEIPGTTDTVKTLALTVTVTAHLGNQSQKSTDTVHQIPLNGRWYQAIEAAAFAKCMAL